MKMTRVTAYQRSIPNEARDYDIEADWVINQACSFRCVYCFSRMDREHPAVGRISNDQFVRFFSKTGLRWHLHLTGGEPLIVPGFIDLLTALARQHRITLNSNLFPSRALQLIGRIDPESVDAINAALHWSERLRKKDVDGYISRVNSLREAGFRVRPLCVMTPEVLDQFEVIQSRFQSAGIVLIPKGLQGDFAGQRYPAAYTPVEVERFDRFSIAAEEAIDPLGPSRFQQMIGDHAFERMLIRGKPDFRGHLCDAGHRFFSIREDGKIYRCGKSRPIGNIATDQWEPLDKPKPCRHESCIYYCYLYSSATAPGMRFLVGPPRTTIRRLTKRILQRTGLLRRR